MANRHKKPDVSFGNKDVTKEAFGKKSGGRVTYDGADSNVAKEAKEKKDGGPVVGRKCGGRLDKRARGGGVFTSAGGGNADKSPFSSAKTGK